MTLTQSLISFILAASLLTVTPGLDTALVLRTAMAKGSGRASQAAAGVITGCLVWGGGVAVGLGVLLTTAPLAFTLMKWGGAAYLVWFGMQLVRQPRMGLTLAADDTGSNWFLKGVLQNLLNPKIGIFYISFLPQFVPAHEPVAAFTFLLALVHAGLTILWFGAIILATQPLARWLQRPAIIKTMDRITGCVFIGFGLELAFSRR